MTTSYRDPKVSVLIITYNHEPFIAQAIESALMQITDFDFEIVIGEDCSTDRTRDIVASYRKRYPDRIRVLFQLPKVVRPPLGLEFQHNLAMTYKACRGQYVAFLEGDDYWTSEFKLQRQVDLLDKHPACTISCHPVNVIYPDGGNKSFGSVTGISPKAVCTIYDVLSVDAPIDLRLVSTMVRRSVLEEFPNWFYDIMYSDGVIHLLMLANGNIVFHQQAMAVYRKHLGGISHLQQTHVEYCNDMMLKMYTNVDRYLEFRYHDIIGKYVAIGWLNQAAHFKKRNEMVRAIYAYIQVFKNGPAIGFRHLLYSVQNMMKLAASRLLKMGWTATAGAEKGQKGSRERTKR